MEFCQLYHKYSPLGLSSTAKKKLRSVGEEARILDKLCFMYINTRSLWVNYRGITAMEADLENELLNIEDDIFQQEDPDLDDVEDEELEEALV
jgi:hypothetical protein